MVGTVYKDRVFIGKKPREGNKRNKREELSLIKYKSEWRKTIKVYLSHCFVKKYTFSTY